MKALTYDQDKPPLAYLPSAALREISMVQEYGARKYGTTDNFRQGMEVRRNLSCALRHIYEYLDGNDLDNESGRNHLAHAACRLMFVLQNIKDGVAVDDRYRKDKKNEEIA
jgi:hypothetical protein